MVVGLKCIEINNPDIILFDKAQYAKDGPLIKQMKAFHVKIVSKGVPSENFETDAPTLFLLILQTLNQWTKV